MNSGVEQHLLDLWTGTILLYFFYLLLIKQFIITFYMSNDLDSSPLPQIFTEKANLLEKLNKTGMFLFQVQDGFIHQKGVIFIINN